MMGYVISINSHRWSFSFTIRTLIRALITWLKGKHQEKKKKGLSELERQNLKFLFQNYPQHYFGLSRAMTQQPLNTKLLICRFHKITYLCEGSTRGFFFSRWVLLAEKGSSLLLFSPMGTCQKWAPDKISVEINLQTCREIQLGQDPGL